MSTFSNLTSCTPTAYNWYLANSLTAAVSEPALYRLLTFQVPNLISLFRCLGHTKISAQVHSFLCEHFVSWCFLRWGVVSTLPNPQAGGPSHVGCLLLLIQCIRSYPPYWRLFIRLKTKEAPCCGDRDPLIMVMYRYCLEITLIINQQMRLYNFT